MQNLITALYKWQEKRTFVTKRTIKRRRQIYVHVVCLICFHVTLDLYMNTVSKLVIIACILPTYIYIYKVGVPPGHGCGAG